MRETMFEYYILFFISCVAFFLAPSSGEKGFLYFWSLAIFLLLASINIILIRIYSLLKDKFR